jgi:hypothetical protein
MQNQSTKRLASCRNFITSMFVLFLLAIPLGILASPIDADNVQLQPNKDRLLNALAYFGQENFTWPELEFSPVYHSASLTKVNEPQNADAAEANAFVIPQDDPALKLSSEPPEIYDSIVKKPVYVLHHPANDGPADPEKDVNYVTEVDSTQPICDFFQHSVIGADFGEGTFPRVSFVSSETLPFRVHYTPDDDLRYESYQWPLAACNHACELQALTIRALFDWELDPVNEDSQLDEGTKRTLSVAREICQWKNVRRYFVLNDRSKDDLAKRFVPVQISESLSGNIEDTASPDAVFVSDREPTPATLDVPVPKALGLVDVNDKPPNQRLYLTEAAQAAMQEIRNIFASTKGPEDLAQMFQIVIIACQIHHYTSTPMTELEMSSLDLMVQQAMSQVGQIFAETQGRIDVWETRDAIVRATQIYRYQEEQNLLKSV